MLWNLAQLVGARVIPLALENNERGLVELWPSGAANGLSLDQLVQEVEKGRIQSLYLAGRFPPLGESRPDFLIVQDGYRGANNRLADIVLPAATWAEAEGTFVNVEGRIQKYKRLIEPLGESRPDWWIFCRLAEKMGSKDFVYQSAAEIAEEMSKMLPSLHETSSHHLKKGRPSFVLEGRKAVSQLIPLASSGGTGGIGSDSPASEGWVDIPDYYRGLNLCEEVKGLRRLREKTKTSRPKTGRIERES
jgi:NADH dehydrogenase/NADH:ubiquinone oxidoreductase subunit G